MTIRPTLLPSFGSTLSYAAFPVWKDSARSEVKFVPLSKKQAVKIFHDARRFERQTATTRVDAYGRRSTQGKLGRMGLLVLHALLFDFLNYNSGRLDPSYAAIAEKAIVSVRSVARALVKLKAAGVLHWVRRCAAREDKDGRFCLEQETNAYGVSAPGSWKGYRPAPETPPPQPGTWGDPPPRPPELAQAAEDLRHGLTTGSYLAPLAGALGRLGARRAGS